MKTRVRPRVAKTDLGSLVVWHKGEKRTVTHSDIEDWGYAWVGGDLLDLKKLRQLAGS